MAAVHRQRGHDLWIVMLYATLWGVPTADALSLEFQGDCKSYRGSILSCQDLKLAQRFNQEVMPGMLDASYREIRAAMTSYGLPGHNWHVGHACPDTNKHKQGHEDTGQNLFAQHALDNMQLGHCLVSCAETEYLAARHVHCNKYHGCIVDCHDISVAGGNVLEGEEWERDESRDTEACGFPTALEFLYGVNGWAHVLWNVWTEFEEQAFHEIEFALRLLQQTEY